MFYAIDGRTGYWRTPAGVHAVNLDTGDDHVVLLRLSDFRGLYSVENGVLACRHADDTVDAIFVGRSFDGAKELVRQSVEHRSQGGPRRLSPSGAWLSVGMSYLEHQSDGSFVGARNTAEVYNTSTGQHVTLDVPLDDRPGFEATAIPVIWLDDITVQVWGQNANLPDVTAALFTCTVPDGTCRVASGFDIVITGIGELTVPVVMPDGRGGGGP